MTRRTSNIHERLEHLFAPVRQPAGVFFSSKTLGEHHIQLKDHYVRQSDVSRRSVPGDTIEELNGPAPTR